MDGRLLLSLFASAVELRAFHVFYQLTASLSLTLQADSVSGPGVVIATASGTLVFYPDLRAGGAALPLDRPFAKQAGAPAVAADPRPPAITANGSRGSGPTRNEPQCQRDGRGPGSGSVWKPKRALAFLPGPPPANGKFFISFQVELSRMTRSIFRGRFFEVEET